MVKKSNRKTKEAVLVSYNLQLLTISMLAGVMLIGMGVILPVWFAMHRLAGESLVTNIYASQLVNAAIPLVFLGTAFVVASKHKNMVHRLFVATLIAASLSALSDGLRFLIFWTNIWSAPETTQPSTFYIWGSQFLAPALVWSGFLVAYILFTSSKMVKRR